MIDLHQVATRPKFPHVETYESVLKHYPEVLDEPATVTEKVHGRNARVGRDENGLLWFGSRNVESDDFVIGGDNLGLVGFPEYAAEHFTYLPNGVTVFGEWAGEGTGKLARRIDYGDPKFYVFGESMNGGQIDTSAAALDQHWLMGFGNVTVPIIYEGKLDWKVLDEIRQGESIIAPGQPIEGLVISPLKHVIIRFADREHQVIVKYKSPRYAEVTSAEEKRTPPDMTTAVAFAQEYVNLGRMEHVLDLVRDDQGCESSLDVIYTGFVMKAMYDDVLRDARPEYEALTETDQRLVGKAISREVAAYLKALRA